MNLKAIFFILCITVLVSTQNVRVSQFYTDQCKLDTQCLPGYFCMDKKCTDRCILMKCTSGTICEDGTCNPICGSNNQCQQGFICNGKYCVDLCRQRKCPLNSLCRRGKCYPISKECLGDEDCEDGFYCTKKGVCEDMCKIENYCKAQQRCVAGQCISVTTQEIIFCPKSIQCTDPRPDKEICPTLYFIGKPDPIVCGLTSEGKLLNFPVECYACRDQFIVSYFNTSCDKIPSEQLTLIEDSQPKCNNDQIILNGKCLPKRSDPAQITCSDPRPDEDTCPTIFWVRQPDPVVCGVNQNGNYVDFPIQCYACKQKDIVFYYNRTCLQVKKSVQTVRCDIVFCPIGKVCKEGKCIQAPAVKTITCFNPRPVQKNCPTINFIKQPSPLFCGVNSRGDLVDFPVECYACKQKDIIYYYKKRCSQINSILCAAIKCKEGYECFEGKCILTKWPICQDNTRKITCGKLRPNNKTCPLIQFFKTPQNTVCGITKTGQRISYPIECYACKNDMVRFYYNQSCEYLSSHCPESTKCISQNDCQQNQSCINQVCINECIFTLCPVGTNCFKGKCLQQVRPKDCSLIRCKEGFKCENGECVDLCKDIFCIATHTCVDGKCVPIPIDIDSCATVKCEPGFKCENGECVDLCKDIFCIATHTCVDGKCVPILIRGI